MLNDVYKVFVYGTLRKGCRNHVLLANGQAEFLGTATHYGYCMWDFGSYPGIAPSKRVQDSIETECYKISYSTLSELDKLEDYYGSGHPDNLYERKLITSAEGITGWIYIIRPEFLVYMQRKWKTIKTVQNGNWPPVEKDRLHQLYEE
ncbi:MAG: gamma-glutamylcyclotransferase [Balneolales bacterium]|nr:gamma-glutamylcyclotransferase [Balneolales bacterium]